MMKRVNSHGNSFVLYCFSDDTVSKVNTLSQFTSDCGNVVELDGTWEVALKDAYFGDVLQEDDDDDEDERVPDGNQNVQNKTNVVAQIDSESNLDSINIPESYDKQVISWEFLSELLVYNAKNANLYANKLYFDTYSNPSMDYTKFPQYGFRDGYYLKDFFEIPKEKDMFVKCVIRMRDFLSTEKKTYLKENFPNENKDIQTRQVIVKIPLGKDLTLRQIVQIIIRFITSHHAPYVFSTETVARRFRDLERSMVLNAVGMNDIIHNLLNSLFQMISGEVAKQTQNNHSKKNRFARSTNKIDQEADMQLAFIYCDIIRAQVVANNRSKLLALLPFHSKAAFQNVSKPSFCYLENFSFKCIRFEIRNYKGRLVNFKKSNHPTILILQFRKIS